MKNKSKSNTSNVKFLEQVIVKFLSGGTPSTKNQYYWNGEIPWMTSASINGFYVKSGERYISKEGLENSATNVVPKNNLLISTRVGVGKVAVNTIDIAISQDLTGAVVDKEQVDPEYLCWYLLSYKPQNYLKSLVRGSTIKGIARSELLKLKVWLPPLTTQKKIAEILSTADAAIQKVDEAIEKTQRLKKGVMHRLLTKGVGHTEFKDTEIGRIPREWDVRKIEDLIDLCQYGLSVKISDKGNYNIVKMDDIVNNVVIPDKVKKCNIDHSTFEKYSLEKGDVLFNRTNSYELVGRTGIFTLEGDYVFASYLIRIKTNRNILDPNYLTLYLTYSKERLKTMASMAVHQANINATNLKKYKIPVPSLEEQIKMNQIIEAITNRINSQKAKKQKLQRIKQGLMNELLTGRREVRV